MKNTKELELSFYEVVKETAKAVCLKVLVSWNGTCHSRDLWFPKSVCRLVAFSDENGNNRTNALVAEWFIRKTEEENQVAGYQMCFETIF